MDKRIPLAGILSRAGSAASPFVFLGIADDTQSTFLHGPAAAPEIIRSAYDGRCFNTTSETGVELASAVTDLGDLKPSQNWAASAERYRTAIEDVCREGKTPFIVGGDHAVTVPALRAFSVLGQPIHVIQIDAHPDLYANFEGNPDSHACTGARVLEMPHVGSLTQLGIRTLNREQITQADRYGDRLTIWHARDLPGVIPPLTHIPPGAPVYLTIDMDGLDPAVAPGVSHPVPGGLSSRQVFQLIQQGHWTLVGMDVVEVNPIRDLNHQTAILAGRLIHEGVAHAAKGRNG